MSVEQHSGHYIEISLNLYPDYATPLDQSLEKAITLLKHVV